MATREEMTFIRAARAGETSAQLMLGKYYLFGGAGLKQNLATALHWLDRAARRNSSEAWMLIGEHIPFDVAARALDPLQLPVWYERAFDAGVMNAGLVLAKLVLADSKADQIARDKAFGALEAAARAGIVDAQWLLAQELGKHKSGAPGDAGSERIVDSTTLEWATRAASSGILQAQRTLADHAWSEQDLPSFLRWALPVARALAERRNTGDAAPMSQEDARFLTRCASAIVKTPDSDESEAERFWELAAQAGDKEAQLSAGLWFANMDEKGQRTARLRRKSNYRKAAGWLMAAGRQGVAQAWYVLARICLKPNGSFMQLARSDAACYLERAAEAGHCIAQLELGLAAWRMRHCDDASDVRAVYWLQKAAFQGNPEAAALLEKIAPRAAGSAWAQEALLRLTSGVAASYPLLAARVELAALFGLAHAETLLIDPHTADCGHCLLVDIRSQHARSRRRLIPIRTGEERATLNRLLRVFENIDCGPNGPEGNYRQRVYLFKKIFSYSEMDQGKALKYEARA
ncbi:MAG: SEL1-like repeat protein [Noviherbaspirillum sp.]|nr:SEL1-like repeat protein [Noviherbaspirillum sp.]